MTDGSMQEETEMSDAIKTCPSCGALEVPDKKFCAQCGEPKGKEHQIAEEIEEEMITEAPVWIILSLKKPLEKLYASDVETMLYEKDGLAKTSIIIIGYSPKESSVEDLKILNDVMEGPWKNLITRPELLIKRDSPYALDKILTYLVKTWKRQEISDQEVEKCHLCGKQFKRIYMEKHVTKLCLKRDELCKYCEDMYPLENMKEHHMSHCPSYPIPCPQKCRSPMI